MNHVQYHLSDSWRLHKNSLPFSVISLPTISRELDLIHFIKTPTKYKNLKVSGYSHPQNRPVSKISILCDLPRISQSIQRKRKILKSAILLDLGHHLIGSIIDDWEQQNMTITIYWPLACMACFCALAHRQNRWWKNNHVEEINRPIITSNNDMHVEWWWRVYGWELGVKPCTVINTPKSYQGFNILYNSSNFILWSSNSLCFFSINAFHVGVVFLNGVPVPFTHATGVLWALILMDTFINRC